MALTANTDKAAGGTLRARPGPRNFIVKSASVVYAGALVGLEKSSGHIVPLDDAADRSFVGLSLQNVTGDGTLTCSVNVLDFDAESCNVTGYTAVTANGTPVYCTADNTLTLTRPGDDAVVAGYTIGYVSSGVGNVAFLGQTSAAVLGMAGGSKRRIILTTLPNLAGITGSMNVVTGYKLWGHGKIVALGAIVGSAVTTGSKGATLNAEIATVDVTGGTLVLTSANLTPLGAIVESAAPSGTNEFFDGDVLDIESSAVTAFVEGSISIYIDVEYLQ